MKFIGDFARWRPHKHETSFLKSLLKNEVKCHDVTRHDALIYANVNDTYIYLPARTSKADILLFYFPAADTEWKDSARPPLSSTATGVGSRIEGHVDASRARRHSISMSYWVYHHDG